MGRLAEAIATDGITLDESISRDLQDNLVQGEDSQDTFINILKKQQLNACSRIGMYSIDCIVYVHKVVCTNLYILLI